MNWFLHPDTVPLKIVVMLLAILLFALIMGLVLLLVDRPKAPRWVPVVGYLGPALILPSLESL